MIYDILPVNNYNGNDSCTTFDFDFYIENEEQIKVYHFDEYGLKTKLTHNLDYVINEYKNINGSFITFPIAGSKYNTLASNEKISIELSLPISQLTQYNNSSLLNLEALEYSLDYLTRLIQIYSRKFDLCVKVDECSDISPVQLIQDLNDKAKIAKDSSDNAYSILGKIQTIYNYIESKKEQIDAIEAAQSTKSNIDASNFSDTGRKTIAGYSFPSSTFINITPGASATAYTAPANGIVTSFMTATADNGYVGLRWGNTVINMVSSMKNTTSGAVLLPVQKGQSFSLIYGNGTPSLRFYYAQGEV